MSDKTTFLKDLEPLPKGRSHFIESYGITFETYSRYAEFIFCSKKRKIPVFLFNDIGFNDQFPYYFSDSYTNFMGTRETPSFFMSQDSFPNILVRELIVFTSPIELLSYHQIYGPKENVKLVSLNCISKANHIMLLNENYPNAKLFYAKKLDTVYEELMFMSMNFELKKIKYSFLSKGDNIEVKFRKRTFTIPVEQLTQKLRWGVIDKTKNKIFRKEPPHPFHSFNQIINGY